MDIVTIAGTGRRVASWRTSVDTSPSGGVTVACEQQGQHPRPRVRGRELRNLPTFDPQRPSAARAG